MLRPANVSEMQMQKLWRYVRGKQSFSLLFVSFTGFYFLLSFDWYKLKGSYSLLSRANIGILPLGLYILRVTWKLQLGS